MARRRLFSQEEELRFLAQAGEWRRQCIAVLIRAKPQGPLYKAVEQIMDGIDSVAGVVTGDRQRFHQPDAGQPGRVPPDASE